MLLCATVLQDFLFACLFFVCLLFVFGFCFALFCNHKELLSGVKDKACLHDLSILRGYGAAETGMGVNCRPRENSWMCTLVKLVQGPGYLPM